MCFLFARHSRRKCFAGSEMATQPSGVETPEGAKAFGTAKAVALTNGRLAAGEMASGQKRVGTEQRVKRAGGTPFLRQGKPALRNPGVAFVTFYGEHGMPRRRKSMRVVCQRRQRGHAVSGTAIVFAAIFEWGDGPWPGRRRRPFLWLGLGLDRDDLREPGRLDRFLRSSPVRFR